MLTRFSKFKYMGWVSAFLLLVASGCQVAAQPTSLVPIETSVPIASPTVSISSATLPPTTSLLADQNWLAYPYQDGIAVVNQDGSGRLLIGQSAENVDRDCVSPGVPLMLDENPYNRIVKFETGFYLIQPPASARFYRSFLPECRSFSFLSRRNEKDPLLLASIDGEVGSESLALVIWELPLGKIHTRISLINCAPEASDCSKRDRRWHVAWSPSGRYLAYPAIQGGTSTDLFIYDRNTGEIRRLTEAPEEVEKFWWSPDDAWLILSESRGTLSDKNYESSLWAVSLESSEIRFLYTPAIGNPVNFAGWIDNEHFLTYEGNLDCCGTPYGRNLTRVHLMTDGAVDSRIFASPFVDLVLDHINQRILVQSLMFDKPAQIVILSMSGGVTARLGEVGFGIGEWNPELQLYITDTDCEGKPGQKKAFGLGIQGKVKCVLPPSTPTPTAAAFESAISPDQRWQVLLTGAGVKLKNLSDQSELFVTESAGTQVIWCPDSTCFYLISNRILYRVSLPDLTLQTIDPELRQDKIEAHWLEKPASN